MIHWFIHWLKKIRDNFRVYLERAHPAFLTTIVVLVYPKTSFWNWTHFQAWFHLKSRDDCITLRVSLSRATENLSWVCAQHKLGWNGIVVFKIRNWTCSINVTNGISVLVLQVDNEGFLWHVEHPYRYLYYLSKSGFSQLIMTMILWIVL